MMKTITQSSRFKSDPWDGKDLLGRKTFAEQLAQQIRAWKDKESLVVGMFGEWGNGKSVVKDMVVKSLRSDASTCPQILNFNPWEWSGHEQLTAALFNQIRTTLGKQDAGEKSKKVAVLLEFYESYLNTATLGLEGLKSTLEKALIAFAVIAFAFSSSTNSYVCKYIGYSIGGIALSLTFFKSLADFLRSLAKTYDADAERRTKTLEELKSEISETLQDSEIKPLLIIIDDVDRLSADEIKRLFQLIKANVNFPNIIFFLIFQKDIIERALELTFHVGSGKEYLKKIIHVGFDLPQIERRRLEEVLRSELQRVILENGVAIDGERLGGAFQDKFAPMFKNLRDVNRFMVTFEFHLGLFKPNNALEVDCLDLALLGALKQYDEGVYQKIPSFRNALLREAEVVFKREEAVEREYSAAMAILVNSVPDAKKETVREVLGFLFPASFLATGENVDKWFKEFRICDTDGFARYFLFSVPIGAISKSEVDYIKSVVCDSGKLTKTLKQYHSEKRLYHLLRYLLASVDEIDLKNLVPAFVALFNMDDCIEIPPSGLDWYPTSSADISVRIIHGFLLRISEVGKRGPLLLEAIQKSLGFVLAVKIVSDETARRARNPEYCKLTEDALPYLQSACLEKIRAWAKTEDSLKHSKVIDILFSWQSWGAKAEVTSWVKNAISSKEGLLVFLETFIGRVELKQYDPFNDKRLLGALAQIGFLIPLAEINERIESFGLKSDTSRAIVNFQTAFLNQPKSVEAQVEL